MTREEAISKLNELIECTIDRGMIDDICQEVIEFLEAQKPRVMTPEEVRSLPEGSVVWFEERDNGGRTYIQPMMSNGKAFMIGTHLDINVSRGALNWEGRRFWTSRPADEQRKAAPWIKLID